MFSGTASNKPVKDIGTSYCLCQEEQMTKAFIAGAESLFLFTALLREPMPATISADAQGMCLGPKQQMMA